MDEFTMLENLLQNKEVAQPGPYFTTLNPMMEDQFRKWLVANKVPFNADQPMQDYDMRGFYLGLMNKDPRATTGINPVDKRLHYTDYWKTPYHSSFSRESKYALPTAPRWEGQNYIR